MIDYTCPKCGAAMSSPDSLAGRSDTCPACGNVVAIHAKRTGQYHRKAICIAIGVVALLGISFAGVKLYRNWAGVPIVEKTQAVKPVSPALSREKAVKPPASTLSEREAAITKAERKKAIAKAARWGIDAVWLNNMVIRLKREYHGAQGRYWCVISAILDMPECRNKVALEKEIRKIIEMDRYQKSFRRVSVSYLGRKTSGLGTTLEFSLFNTTDTPIKTLKGRIIIYDQFGNGIEYLDLKLDEPMSEWGSVNIKRTWFVRPRTLKLLDDQTVQIKIKFQAIQIIYQDGSREVFE